MACPFMQWRPLHTGVERARQSAARPRVVRRARARSTRRPLDRFPV